MDAAEKIKPHLPMLNSVHNANKTTFFAKKLGVFNGIQATPGQFPYIVSLSIAKSDGYTYRCGGMLFAHNLVVTAGKWADGLCISSILIYRFQLTASALQPFKLE